MLIGVGLTQRHQPELARDLEVLGFDGLWVGGHVLWHAPMLDPLAQLAAYAAVTSRIRLGTSVLLLPLYHPVLLAKTVTTVDILSGGRVVLGVGVGGENPAEFEAMGIGVGERGRRADESIPLLRALWSGRPVTHEGRFYPLREAVMAPAPVQAGGPPVWIAGRSPAALARTARCGDGWIGIFCSPTRYGAAVRDVTRLCAETGRHPAELTFAHYLWMRPGRIREQATAAAREYLERSYARPFTADQVPRFCAAGTGDDLREQVAEYAAAGCQYLIAKPACEPGELADQCAAIAEAFRLSSSGAHATGAHASGAHATGAHASGAHASGAHVTGAAPTPPLRYARDSAAEH
jgi:probable F420-dependent oxidoreductase